MLFGVQEEHRLFVYPTPWVVFRPNYLTFLSYHYCRVRVIYLRTILDTYAETS